jgi:hypothetical protein
MFGQHPARNSKAFLASPWIMRAHQTDTHDQEGARPKFFITATRFKPVQT